MITIDPNLAGTATAPQDFLVERGAIRRFAEAIGDTNPLYLDEAAAQAAGYPSVIAPPTFPTTFRVPMPIELDMSHVLHGEQEYSFTRPIVAGDTLHCVNTITKIFAREGSLGHMTFVYLETTGDDPHGQRVFTGKSTIIVH